jgi:hypothetical protein
MLLPLMQTQGMAAAVSARGRLIDSADRALGDSLVATKRNAATAKEQVKRCAVSATDNHRTHVQTA